MYKIWTDKLCFQSKHIRYLDFSLLKIHQVLLRKKGNCKVQQNCVSRTSIYFQEKMNIVLKQLWLSKSVTLRRKLLPSYMWSNWELTNTSLSYMNLRFSHFHWCNLTVRRAWKSFINQAVNVLNKALLWTGYFVSWR